MAGVQTNKRTSESKYVSVFADSQPDVDVTFREELLKRPSDHYMVGVDNLTVSLNSLSMLDIKEVGSVIKICKYVAPGVIANNNQFYDPTQTVQTNLNYVGATVLATAVFAADSSLEVQSTQDIPFYNVNQFMRRLKVIGDLVSQLMKTTDLAHAGAGEYIVGFTRKVAGEKVTHLAFELRSDGRIEVVGTRAFWANFFISIEEPKYQHILDGGRVATGIKLIGVHPMTSAARPLEGRSDVAIVGLATANANAGQVVVCFKLLGTDPGVAGISAANMALLRGPAVANAAADYATREVKLRKVLGGNVYATLDRRVSLEMGCSLPIVNSPMVDHNKESPDFVLGRWIFNSRHRMSIGSDGKDARNELSGAGVTEYQNSTDRVAYHALMPQEKVQTLRLKLFLRIRTYDEATDKFGMDTIECPTSKTDW